MANVSSMSAVRRRDAADARGRLQPSTPSSTLVVITAVIINVTLPAINACSMPKGWRPTTPVEQLLDASDVLYARVIRNVPDLRFDYGNTNTSTAYTSEIEVHCILKGRQTPSRINITQAGHVPGLCHSTNLTVGHRYVLAVRLDDGIYTTTSGEFNGDTERQLGQLTIACDLIQQYPTGVDASTASVKCPEIAPPGKCKSKRDFEVASTPSSGPEDEEDDDYAEPKAIRVGETKDQSKSESSSYHTRSSTVIMYVIMALLMASVA